MNFVQIFCGGLPSETSKREIRAYDSRYGQIQSVKSYLDEDTSLDKFIFVTYDTIDAANAAVKKPKQMIKGKECDVEKIISENDGWCKLEHLQWEPRAARSN